MKAYRYPLLRFAGLFYAPPPRYFRYPATVRIQFVVTLSPDRRSSRWCRTGRSRRSRSGDTGRSRRHSGHRFDPPHWPCSSTGQTPGCRTCCLEETDMLHDSRLNFTDTGIQGCGSALIFCGSGSSCSFQCRSGKNYSKVKNH